MGAETPSKMCLLIANRAARKKRQELEKKLLGWARRLIWEGAQGIPCWSGEVVPVAFAIGRHDREVPAFVVSPRPLTGADIRTLMDRTLWARFGEATLKAPHAIQWLSDNTRHTGPPPQCVGARARTRADYHVGV